MKVFFFLASLFFLIAGGVSSDVYKYDAIAVSLWFCSLICMACLVAAADQAFSDN